MTPVGFCEMPRGSGAVSASKCPHFDIGKSAHLELFMNCYNKIKLSDMIERLKPASKTALSSKFGLKVAQMSKFCGLIDILGRRF